ncbi:MAG: hypothetical protein K2Q20_07850, partial [Phycisphaerales bacterium]|nr:hypothetical protein [Phycisphaerales bacterium]
DVGFPFKLGAWGGIVAEQVGLSLNNTLTPKRTVSEGGCIQFITGSVKGGYGPTRITERNIVLSLDPDRPLKTDFNLYKLWRSNAEFPLSWQSGLLSASGHMAFVVHGPRVSIDNEELTDGDRNGVRTSPLELKFNGDADDEIILAQVVVP